MMTAPRQAPLHRRAVAWSLVTAALLTAAPAVRAASTVRVDDSGTIVNQPVVAMRWRKPVPSRAQDNNVDAEIRVALRLNMAPFLNQPVRLFMGLAPVTGDPVSATWRTQGRLLPGTGRQQRAARRDDRHDADHRRAQPGHRPDPAVLFRS
jgi:hypothetical protein